MDFKDFIMTLHITLLAQAQSIEEEVKYLTLYKKYNRDEDTNSFIASIRSLFDPSTKQSMMEDEEFLKQKITNADSREFFDAKVFNANFLMQVSTEFSSDMPREEFEC